MSQIVYRVIKASVLTDMEYDNNLRGLDTRISALENATPFPSVVPTTRGGTGVAQTLSNNNRIIITSAGTMIPHVALTASRAMVTDGSGLPFYSAVTATELGYVAGVTSAIQTQINGKYAQPAGTISQYIRGDGSLATFPGGLPPSGSAGGDLTGTYPNPSIATNAVTLAKFQQVATATLIGRATGGTGNIEVLTDLPFTVSPAKGGTGITSYTIGDLIYASGTTTLSKLADVAAGSYLRSGGVGAAPVWSTTTLPNSATTGDLLYASASNTYSNLADIATGNALISGGVATAPSWGKIGLTTHVTGVLPVANGGTGSSTTFTQGSIVFAGASGVYSQDNANLFWDDTNNRLGIGTATPSRYLNVVYTENVADMPQVVITNNGTGNGSGLMVNAGGSANPNIGFGVSGTARATLAWVQSLNSMGLLNLAYTTSAYSLLLDNAGALIFQDLTAAQRVKFTAAGQVIINTGGVAIGRATVTSNVHLDVINGSTGKTASFRISQFSASGATFNTTSSALQSYTGYFESTATRSAGGNNLTNIGIYATASGAQLNYAAIFENGVIGIGTTTPVNDVHLERSTSGSGVGYLAKNTANNTLSSAYFQATNADSSHSVRLTAQGQGSSDHAAVGSYSDTAFGIVANSVERATFLTTGLVGLGQTAPLYNLHLGTLPAPFDTATEIYIEGKATGGNVAGIDVTMNSVEMGMLINTTNPNLGTFSSHDLRLVTNGTLAATVKVGGNFEIVGAVKTAQPSANGAGTIKLGKTKAGAVTPDGANYWEIDDNGTIIKVIIST